jgi:hypothetical protein
VFRKRSFSRPKSWTRDKDSLMQEKQHLKEDNHKLKDENIKLKTRVLFLDKEMDKRDKFVEQTISNTQNMPMRLKKTGYIIKTSLVNNLKRQLRDDREQIKVLQTELTKHHKDRKTTTINELGISVQTLTDECIRLRSLLKQSLKREDQVTSNLILYTYSVKPSKKKILK